MLSPFSNASIEVVQGSIIKRIARAASPAERALLAADLEDGRVIIERPTSWQARTLTGASAPYHNAVRKLSPVERNALRTGALKLSQLLRQRWEPSDAKLDRLIARYGANRVMAALDRVTAPQRVAAE